MLRRCDACGDEAWRPLDGAGTVRRVDVNAWLSDGRRADLVLLDQARQAVLVVQLTNGSRLRDRSQTAAGAPLLVLDGRAILADPLRLRPTRERGLPAWPCRCARARALPVDDAFSLRAIGCPLNLRRQHEAGVLSDRGGGESYASVIQDCARCSFFVGIGYSDPERRRVSLYCSFEAAARQRGALLTLRRAPPSHPPEAMDGAVAVDLLGRTTVAQ